MLFLLYIAIAVVALAWILAKLGGFKGDVFVAASVLGCAALLFVFIAYPVGQSLVGAFVTEDGQWSLAALWERAGNARIWGLGCLNLHAPARCGVAWNTLYLGLLTATGTVVMGTVLALMAERYVRKTSALQKPLQLLALLPIITPPFVVGLGLILLFGRAGVVNQLLEAWFGIEPTRWFYGVLGVWIAQMFAFTPIAYMMMRGVVQGVSPSLEEASQSLRANPGQTFHHVTLPLLKPGLANAFLVGFIESMADFGNPIIVGGQFNVLSTEIFFAIVGAQYDQGRAATLALILTGFALAVFALQRAFLGRQIFTTLTGKGDAGLPVPLPAGVRRTVLGLATPWLLFTLVIYCFAFAGGFVKTWGRDYSLTLAHFKTAFDWEWGEFGMVWSGTAWSSLLTTVKLAALSSPLTASLGLLIAWLLARTAFKGQALFEFAALLAFAIPGTVLGVSYILAFNVPPIELTGGDWADAPSGSHALSIRKLARIIRVFMANGEMISIKRQAYPNLLLSLQWANPQHRSLLPRHTVARSIRHALRWGAVHGVDVQSAQITVRVVDVEEGRSLNAHYRGKDYATNVLTFDYVNAGAVCADLVLCAPVLAKEAQAQGKDLRAHYVHMLVHGTLHALGYDHERSAKATREMEGLEVQILQGLGFDNPY